MMFAKTTTSSAAMRLAVLPVLSAKDAVRLPAKRLLPRSENVRADALDAAIAWLVETHRATGRRGSSKGFSLLRGWLPAYPETTGYVLGTLLDYSSRSGDTNLARRAHEMGDWEVSVQCADGGVMEGTVGTLPTRSIVFNTGMVLHGYVDLIEAGSLRFEEAAVNAGRFLVERLRADGTWDPAHEYSGIPHTYNSRVSWAMIRLALHREDDELLAAARRQLDWVTRRQRPNGWFEGCVFKPGMLPSTHGIAYTLRGLLESHALVNEPRYLDSVVRVSEVLIRKLEVLEVIPASWDRDWKPCAGYECLTGTVQLGGVWLRLFQLTDDARYLNAGLKAIDLAVARQERAPWGAVHGALPGSFPVWGRYAPLQYPNWATKFLADALMLRDDCLRAL
jgi:hypothetical protein